MALPSHQNVPMGFTPRIFSTPAEYVAELERLKQLRPGVFDYHVGPEPSAVGVYSLYYVTLGDITKPTFFLSAAAHCWNEKDGVDIVLRFLERFLNPYDPQYAINHAFLNHYSIVAVPMMNAYGYFTPSPEPSENNGWHGNGNVYSAGDLSAYTPNHDLTNYAVFTGGVNLNRNYATGTFATWPNLPFRSASLWNGQDYSYGNYFMMPYYFDGVTEHYDPWNETYPSGTHNVYKPHPSIYDGKGPSAFSEPETRLVRDLCEGTIGGANVVAHWDIHTNNPWQTTNSALVSKYDNYTAIRASINAGIAASNNRYLSDTQMPATTHNFTEDYDAGDAPFAGNWASNYLNGVGVFSISWETGTNFDPEHWTDTYMEVLYRWLALGQVAVAQRELQRITISHGPYVDGNAQLYATGIGTDGKEYFIKPEWAVVSPADATISSSGILTLPSLNQTAIVQVVAEGVSENTELILEGDLAMAGNIDGIIDAGLNACKNNAIRATVCSGEPGNYAGIAAVALGQVTISSADFTGPTDDTSGRKLTFAGKTGVYISANGEVTFCAFHDNSSVLYATAPVTSQAVVTGQSWTLPSCKISVSDPA